jgi:hypothetical protein
LENEGLKWECSEEGKEEFPCRRKGMSGERRQASKKGTFPCLKK